MSNKLRRRLVIIGIVIVMFLLFAIVVGITFSLSSNEKGGEEISLNEDDEHLKKESKEQETADKGEAEDEELKERLEKIMEEHEEDKDYKEEIEETSIEEEELFKQSMRELIESSNGSVVGARPYLRDEDWSNVAVIVDDAWYYLQDYEKERFAEQISSIFDTFLKNSGKVTEDRIVMTVIIDMNEKELASPKALGGYKIKR